MAKSQLLPVQPHLNANLMNQAEHKELELLQSKSSSMPVLKLSLQTGTQQVENNSKVNYKGTTLLLPQSDLLFRKATFIETDISSWPSILNLFKTTHERYGRIDLVAANAGIHGHERWLEDITTADGELAQPEFPAITVNLIGMLYSISPTFTLLI